MSLDFALGELKLCDTIEKTQALQRALREHVGARPRPLDVLNAIFVLCALYNAWLLLDV